MTNVRFATLFDTPPKARMCADDYIASPQSAHKSDLIEGVGGELSPFEELHGFALDGVDLTTSVLPLGWRERLVAISNEFTKDPVTGKQYAGLCLDPADLCVAKLCAGREKDRAFVAALFQAHLVDRAVVWERLQNMPPEHAEVAAAVLAELTGHTR